LNNEGKKSPKSDLQNHVMFARFRFIASLVLATLALAAAIAWVTSYARPNTWFLDIVGSIKEQNEFAEKLKTQGHATSNNPWFGPIGILTLEYGTLTLQYDGAEWIGSIPPHPQNTSAPARHVTTLNLGVFHFHRVGPSPPWSFGNWKCDVSLWFLFLFLAAYPLIVFAKVLMTRRRRTRWGLCIKCGYNLAGLTQPRCPECGNAFELKSSD